MSNEAFEKWAINYGLDYEPSFTRDDVEAAWQAAKADSESILSEQQNTIAELKEKLTTELKRGGSYKLLVSSLEGQLEHYRNQDYTLAKARLDTLEQSLNSEREMNEILTNEITELQAHINDLREALEKLAGTNGYVKSVALQALASTPAQSLLQHDNEVIEQVVTILKDSAWGDGIIDMRVDDLIEDVRALKG